MKSIIKILLVLMASNNLMLYGQNATSASSTLALTAYIPSEVENSLGKAAADVLKNKLNEVITANGVSNSAINNRFILTSNAQLITKDIQPGAPAMIAISLNLTLFIGDGFEGSKFSSQSFTLKGVGINETKAYIDAIRMLKVNNEGLVNFVKNGKTKIIEFYNARCSFILKEVQALEATYKYDEALYKLIGIPVEASECYTKALGLMNSIFKKKIDRDCKQKLVAASSLWSANQNWETANEVGQLLMDIDPESACYKDAKSFLERVRIRVLELDKREWNYKLELDVNLERDRIKAIRDIGVAYGNGQPQSIVYNVRGWW